MKTLLFVCAFLAATVVSQEVAVRVLKADVLRDFPGKCFGSTVCRVFDVDEKWPLFPFCGEATCVKNATGLFEHVKDCGPRVKPNNDCTVEFPDGENIGPFPACCPKVNCAAGTKPEYYTAEELEKLAAEELAAREAAAAAGGSTQVA
ncbi:uncharacterized protein [Panulirus ornatus]|uniref:uncharacterized protein n=1 Tax=Panulirus ornatus TaxID=150431 RepID=UPI003A8AFEE4